MALPADRSHPRILTHTWRRSSLVGGATKQCGCELLDAGSSSDYPSVFPAKASLSLCSCVLTASSVDFPAGVRERESSEHNFHGSGDTARELETQGDLLLCIVHFTVNKHTALIA